MNPTTTTSVQGTQLLTWPPAGDRNISDLVGAPPDIASTRSILPHWPMSASAMRSKFRLSGF
jgi:hypothetical protein